MTRKSSDIMIKLILSRTKTAKEKFYDAQKQQQQQQQEIKIKLNWHEE